MRRSGAVYAQPFDPPSLGVPTTAPVGRPREARVASRQPVVLAVAEFGEDSPPAWLLKWWSRRDGPIVARVFAVTARADPDPAPATRPATRAASTVPTTEPPWYGPTTNPAHVDAAVARAVEAARDGGAAYLLLYSAVGNGDWKPTDLGFLNALILPMWILPTELLIGTGAAHAWLIDTGTGRALASFATSTSEARLSPLMYALDNEAELTASQRQASASDLYAKVEDELSAKLQDK